jgi:hypothetical protein
VAEDLKITIRKLPKRQREALGQLCCGNDFGMHPRTAEALVRKGLAREYVQTLPGRFAVVVKRYDVADIPVHIAWCEVCSEEDESQGGEKVAAE